LRDHTLVFVPGILGTELYYHGEGPTKKLITEPVWSSDLAAFLRTVKSYPARLRVSTPLKVGDVIRSLSFGRFGSFPIYGDFIEKFLAGDLGYKEDKDLILFGYDWRAAITRNCSDLATALRAVNGNIRIVAHSMGGLIVRCMLHNPAHSDIRSRVRSVTHIATPVRGSSKAYYTLKKEPQFSTLFDWTLKLAYKADPGSYRRLMAALSTCRSLFDMLPPETERILVTEVGDHYSALEADAWPDVTTSELNDIRDTHSILRGSEFPETQSIYSASIATDHYYVVDQYFEIAETNAYGSSLGDGTVIVASAAQGTATKSCHVIGRKVDHVSLPNDPEVWNILKNTLS
jgi:pimeloyl-ACP methyl ester carboxylesterase